MPDVRPLFLAGFAALALAGCGRTDGPPSAADTPPPTLPAEDACGAGKVGAYLNALPSEDTLAKIRQAVGHDRIRRINPGDAVTMDYRPDRLNVEVGDDGKIRLLRCG